MKNIKKILFFIIIFLLIMLIANNAYAFDVGDLTGTPVESPEADKFGNAIITIASTVGSLLSVIILVVIGIKYMIGSTEERASYKKSLMPYVIGCILVFSASTIAGVVYQMITSTIK